MAPTQNFPVYDWRELVRMEEVTLENQGYIPEEVESILEAEFENGYFGK